MLTQSDDVKQVMVQETEAKIQQKVTDPDERAYLQALKRLAPLVNATPATPATPSSPEPDSPSSSPAASATSPDGTPVAGTPSPDGKSTPTPGSPAVEGGAESLTAISEGMTLVQRDGGKVYVVESVKEVGGRRLVHMRGPDGSTINKAEDALLAMLSIPGEAWRLPAPEPPKPPESSTGPSEPPTTEDDGGETPGSATIDTKKVDDTSGTETKSTTVRGGQIVMLSDYRKFIVSRVEGNEVHGAVLSDRPEGLFDWAYWEKYIHEKYPRVEKKAEGEAAMLGEDRSEAAEKVGEIIGGNIGDAISSVEGDLELRGRRSDETDAIFRSYGIDYVPSVLKALINKYPDIPLVDLLPLPGTTIQIGGKDYTITRLSIDPPGPDRDPAKDKVSFNGPTTPETMTLEEFQTTVPWSDGS